MDLFIINVIIDQMVVDLDAHGISNHSRSFYPFHHDVTSEIPRRNFIFETVLIKLEVFKIFTVHVTVIQDLCCGPSLSET